MKEKPKQSIPANNPAPPTWLGELLLNQEKEAPPFWRQLPTENPGSRGVYYLPRRKVTLWQRFKDWMLAPMWTPKPSFREAAIKIVRERAFVKGRQCGNSLFASMLAESDDPESSGMVREEA